MKLKEHIGLRTSNLTYGLSRKHCDFSNNIGKQISKSNISVLNQ